MKKIFFMAALVAAGLSSCSKESVVNTEINKDGNAISFGSYATKGVPVTGNPDFAKSGSAFGVTAFISTDPTNPYMVANTQISYGTAWDYVTKTDVRYWPTNGETLNFYAYAPYNHASITSKSFSYTGVVLNVTVPAEGSQADIMFAEAENISTPTPIAAQPLEFKHALTQVKFAARTNTEGLYVDIAKNGIVLHNINSVGTFSSSSEVAADLTATPPVAANNGWSALGTPTTYTVTNAAVIATYDNDAATPAEQLATIGDPEKTLMLIPQVLAPVVIDGTTHLPTVGDNGAYAVVSCKIYQKLSETSNVYLVGSDATYADVYVPISTKNMITNEELWNRAKIVTYNLLIGKGNGLDPIMFTTTVEDWTDAAESGDWSNE